MRLFYIFILLIPNFLFCQSTADFENIAIPPNSFFNGSEGTVAFESGNVALPTNFSNGFWSGWSVSNVVNTTDPGFMNQYASITGGGVEGSSNYAVCFGSGSVLRLTNDAVGDPVNGLYVTNGTYPYLVIRDGNNFSKRFGGEFGDDPDFFLLTIKGMLGGEVVADSIDFYLADYRFADNSQDYIIDDWTFIDATSLGNVDSLVFSFSGSDNDPVFGLNTPSYVLIDNVETSDATVSTREQLIADEINIYPNPVTDILNVDLLDNQSVATATVFDELGRVVLATNNPRQINVAELVTGVYTLRVRTEAGIVARRFIKNSYH